MSYIYPGSPANQILPRHLVVDGDSSADFDSSVFSIRNVLDVGIQINADTSCTGTMTILGSVDGVVFNVLTITPALTWPISGNTRIISLSDIPYDQLYIHWHDGSSGSNSALFNIFIMAKGK